MLLAYRFEFFIYKYVKNEVNINSATIKIY